MKFKKILEGRALIYEFTQHDIEDYFLHHKKNPMNSYYTAYNLCSDYYKIALKKYQYAELEKVRTVLNYFRRVMYGNLSKNNNSKISVNQDKISAKPDDKKLKIPKHIKDRIDTFFNDELKLDYNEPKMYLNLDQIKKTYETFKEYFTEEQKEKTEKFINTYIEEMLKLKNEKIKEPISKLDPIDLSKLTYKNSFKDLHIIKQMKEEKIKEVKQAEHGCNNTIILKDGIKYVFKSVFGEETGLRRSINQQTYYRKEVASYQLDRIFNLNLVPPTIIKENITFENGLKQIDIGSAQYFEEGDIYKGKLLDIDVQEKIITSDKQSLAFLDFLTGNEDRHAGNFIIKTVNGRSRIAAIDNGLSFGSHISEYINDPHFFEILENDILSKKIVNELKSFNIDKINDLRNNLYESKLIDKIAYKAFLSRLYWLLNNIKYDNDNEGYVIKKHMNPLIESWRESSKFCDNIPLKDLKIEDLESKLKDLINKKPFEEII